MTIPHKPFGELSDAEKGALLLAAWRGEKVERLGPLSGGWDDIEWPSFYSDIIYRIAPEPKTPDMINWEHVSDDVVAMARNKGNQNSRFFADIPVAEDWWSGKLVGEASKFASYRRGTVEWKDSLVIRPGYEDRS